MFYCENLEATLAAVEQAGGRIVQLIFDFPGGRRFHFSAPSDNEGRMVSVGGKID